MKKFALSKAAIATLLVGYIGLILPHSAFGAVALSQTQANREWDVFQKSYAVGPSGLFTVGELFTVGSTPIHLKSVTLRMKKNSLADVVCDGSSAQGWYWQIYEVNPKTNMFEQGLLNVMGTFIPPSTINTLNAFTDVTTDLYPTYNDISLHPEYEGAVTLKANTPYFLFLNTNGCHLDTDFPIFAYQNSDVFPNGYMTSNNHENIPISPASDLYFIVNDTSSSQSATIIVQKETIPNGDPQSFNFTVGGDGYGNFTLTDGATNHQTVNPGTYSVSEAATVGWDQTGAICSDGSPVNAIILDAGETVICTFTNTKGSGSPTLSFLESSPDGLSENDGIGDNKGTAGKTLFEFNIIYTNKDNIPPSFIKLIVEKVNHGGFEDYFSSEMLPFSPLTDYANGKIYVLPDKTFPKGDYRYRFEASDGVSDVQTPFAEFTVGYSNVAFLPGLEASRLYKQGTLFENQLWEPNWNYDIEKLYLSSTTGESLDSSIYTRDVIDEANIIPDPTGALDTNFYKSFISSMNIMKSDGAINDWEALPYDWRLDLDDILTSGKKNGDNISYLQSTSTPFILQELRRLAETSDTGKVTVITHSNGGLLAKYLLKKLEDENDPLLRKVDKLIMVAAPQIGTPAAIEGLLHGDESQLGVGDIGFLLDEERVRELGENMQSAYNLLPSQKYFETVQSPVFEFDDSVSRISELANRNGTQVTTFESMRRFLEGDGTRNQPVPNDEEYPNVLKPHFISKAVGNHQEFLDSWTPNSDIEVIQIGGWGIKTIRGIKYSCGLLTCSSLSSLDRKVLRTNEGDGTVVVPSAVVMTTNSNVERYYVNIRENNSFLRKNRDHSSILEVGSLLSFLKNLIQEDRTLTNYISTTIPPVGNLTALDYIMHSPVDIHLYDTEGNHTGLIPNPRSDSDLRIYEARIPNSYYREYGEVKYAGSDTFAPTTVVLLGKALGTFTFEIEETRGDEIINTLSFVDIPVTSSTKATLAIQNVRTAGALQLDIEGDGVVDFSLTSSQVASPVISLSIFEQVVRTLGFEKGIAQSIIAKITATKGSLERGNTEAARGQLNALVLYLRAQTGKKLDATTVEELIEIIGRIQGDMLE